MNQRTDTPIVIYEDADKAVEVRLDTDRDTVWLTQRQMAELFDTSSDNVSFHLKNIYGDEELEEAATTEDSSVVRQEGKRRVARSIKHYNLDAIISLGYRVNSRRAVQFRQWATRILFLADRNILANQAFNDFSAFPEDALVRIDPEIIRKRGRVPKNGNVFFTIFQTFMTGHDADGNPAPNFGDYPPDFFDFIVIDECHRGGANDESNWRGILEYFQPAVQLGLTATPKRQHNADTYAYFGDPVYIYSLKDGINDGYLTPFKVRQIATTLDDYVYTADDRVIEGEVEQGRRYTEDDFNRVIEIREREQYRVKVFMQQID